MNTIERALVFHRLEQAIKAKLPEGRAAFHAAAGAMTQVMQYGYDRGIGTRPLRQLDGAAPTHVPADQAQAAAADLLGLLDQADGDELVAIVKQALGSDASGNVAEAINRAIASWLAGKKIVTPKPAVPPKAKKEPETPPESAIGASRVVDLDRCAGRNRTERALEFLASTTAGWRRIDRPTRAMMARALLASGRCIGGHS